MPNHRPNFSATFATARSPFQWNSRCSAVGESISGSGVVLPITVTEASISFTPASTLGTRSHSSKAAVLRSLVISSSPAPSM